MKEEKKKKRMKISKTCIKFVKLIFIKANDLASSV